MRWNTAENSEGTDWRPDWDNLADIRAGIDSAGRVPGRQPTEDTVAVVGVAPAIQAGDADTGSAAAGVVDDADAGS